MPLNPQTKEKNDAKKVYTERVIRSGGVTWQAKYYQNSHLNLKRMRINEMAKPLDLSMDLEDICE